MNEERRDQEAWQAAALEGGGAQPPGSTQQRAGGRASEAMDEARQMTERARETAAGAADQASERGYDAAEAGRENAAGGLERAAAGLEERAMGSEGMPARAATRAAEGMQSAAGYLREHESAEIWEDVEQFVRTHPVRSLAGAIATGFIVGRILR